MAVEKKIMLSIVVPCYNAEKYIKLAVDNLENQTFTDWEAIFVDDGSTDSTGKILDELLKDKEKYIVIHKENGGTASTRNMGIEAASGKYITFLDVDDEVSVDIYEKLSVMMDKTGADMSVCGFYFKVEKNDGSRIQTTYLEEKSYPKVLFKSRNSIRKHLVDMWDSDILSNVWNKMYRMELIKDKGLMYRNGHVYTEDRVFNRQFIENCNSIAITDECLYYYIREREGSTTEKYREDYFDIRHKEFNEFQTHFKNMGVWTPKAREYVCREFTERISGCIENIFHADNELSANKKRQKIYEVINHQDVKKAVAFAKCRSTKMKILVLPIKIRSVWLTYILYQAVYAIRKSNPALFHKLKSRR